MYCYLCANKIDEGISFCRNCGAETPASAYVSHKTSWLSTIGNFLLGSVIFLALFFGLIGILVAFFPALGSPQLAVFILLFMGMISSGLCLAVSKRGRKRKGLEFGKKKSPAELHEPELFRLPEDRFWTVPDSVTDSTTAKLRRP